jgi:hypothetical protein
LWKLDEERDTGVGGDGETAADGLDALAHAAEAVAFLEFWVGPVVGDEQGVEAVGGCGEAHAAVGGLGVTHDVGYCFADGEAEYGLFCGVELGHGSFAGQDYACCVEGAAGELHLRGQTLRAIASDRFAYFAEGGARGFFDVGDFCGGALRVAFDETSG